MLSFLLCLSVFINVASLNKYPTTKTEDISHGLYNNAVNSAKLIHLLQKYSNDEEVKSIEDGKLYDTMKLLQKNYDAGENIEKYRSINDEKFQFIKNPDVLEIYRKRIARRNKDYVDSVEVQTRSYANEAMRSGRLIIHNLKTDSKNRYNRKNYRDSSSDVRQTENDSANHSSQSGGNLSRYKAFRVNDEGPANEVTPENTENDNVIAENNNNYEHITFTNNKNIVNNKSYDKLVNNDKENINSNYNIQINNHNDSFGNYNTRHEDNLKSPETFNKVKPFIKKVLNKLQEKSHALIESSKLFHEVNTERDLSNHEISSENDAKSNEAILNEKEIYFHDDRMIRSDTSGEFPRPVISATVNKGSKFNNQWAHQTSKIDSVESRPNTAKKGSLLLPQTYYFKDSSEHIDEYEKTDDFGKPKEKLNTNVFETKTADRETYSKGKNDEWTNKQSHKEVSSWKSKEIDDLDKKEPYFVPNDRWKNQWYKEKLEDKHDDAQLKHTHNSQEDWDQTANQQNKNKENEWTTKDWGRKNDAWNAFYSQKMFKKRKESAKIIDVLRTPDNWNKKNDDWNSKLENFNKSVPKHDDWNSKIEDLNKNIPKNDNGNKNVEVLKKTDKFNKKNDEWNVKVAILNEPNHDQLMKWHNNDEKEDNMKGKDGIWNKKDRDWNKKDNSWNKKEIVWNNKDFIENKEAKEVENKYKLRDFEREDDISSAKDVKRPKYDPFEIKNNKNSKWGNYNTYKGKKIWGGSGEVKQSMKDINKDIPVKVKKNWSSYVGNVGEERPRKQKNYRDSGEKQKAMNGPFGRTPIPFMKKKSIFV